MNYINQINFIVFFQILLVNFLYYIYFNKIKFLFPIDYPSTKIKKHSKATSLSGGVIFFLTFTILYFNSIFYQSTIFINVNLYLFSFSIFILGLIDDYLRLSYSKKFLVLFLIIFFFLSFNADFQIEILRLSNLSQIDKIFLLENLNPFFTIFCILAFMNAVNLFDGIDLQCGLYLLFVNLFLLFKTSNIIFFYFLIPVISFLILNYQKKTFLGDSGTFLVSFLISIYVIYFYKSELIFVDEIFIIMMIPGVDMLRIFFQRVFNKQNPFKGDRNHLHHILLKKFNSGVSNTISMVLILLPIFFVYVLKINTIFSVLLVLLLYFSLLILLNAKYKN